MKCLFRVTSHKSLGKEKRGWESIKKHKGERNEKHVALAVTKLKSGGMAGGKTSKCDERDNYVTKCTVDNRTMRRASTNEKEKRVLVDISPFERTHEGKNEQNRYNPPTLHPPTRSAPSPSEASSNWSKTRVRTVSLGSLSTHTCLSRGHPFPLLFISPWNGQPTREIDVLTTEQQTQGEVHPFPKIRG